MKTGILVLVYVLALCATGGEAAAGSRKPVKSRHGMVVSADSLASAAGVEMLRKGGNAVDAAVAVGFALAVTFPEAGNIGGGGFMMLRMADRRTSMIDFREKAPGRASRDMYLNGSGKPIAEKSLLGALSSGVPGTVAGLLAALKAYGTLDRATVMAPAIRLAQGGFRVDERFASSLKRSLAGMAHFPSSTKIFSKNGNPFEEGDTLRQSDLAATLIAIRDRGEKGFYEGEVARAIAAEMERDGGIISLDDLIGYRAVEREPVTGTYRGYDIISASPPSSGGIILLHILNILEKYDLRSSGFGSSRTVHLFAAAAQRAFADRAEYLGDPDFTAVPTLKLISKEYAAARGASIDTNHALPSRGMKGGIGGEGQNTTHFVAADARGNVVSVTYTLNEMYGSKVVAEGTGVLLNDEMDDFVSKPGVPNLFGLVGGKANEIVPEKRMLSSMTPTIVLKDAKPYILLGARGGSRIPTTVAQTIINIIDFGMNIQEAVDAPRFHYQWLPDTVLCEPRGLAADAVVNLKKMGYAVREDASSTGSLEAILVDPEHGLFLGAPDPREEGVVAGY